MNTGAFGEGFPYTNFHDLNMDWIIKIAKDFLDQYTHIQEIIEQGTTDITELTESGLTQLQDKADNLEQLLQDWYDTHSNDIADQLASALQDLNNWYTTHQNYLDETLTQNITLFNQRAEQKADEVIASIPADYSQLAYGVENDKTLYFKTGEDTVNTYPLNEMTKQDARNSLSAIKILMLESYDIDSNYYIGIKRGDVGTDVHYIFIHNVENNVDTVVSGWARSYEDADGIEWLKLSEQNSSGITGWICVNWKEVSHSTSADIASNYLNMNKLYETTELNKKYNNSNNIYKTNNKNNVVNNETLSGITFEQADSSLKAIKAITIDGYGFDDSAEYNVDLFQRNQNGQHYLFINKKSNGTNTIVCTFSKSYFDPEGLEWVELKENNDSGINGYALVDWSEVVQTSEFLSSTPLNKEYIHNTNIIFNDFKANTMFKKMDTYLRHSFASSLSAIAKNKNGTPTTPNIISKLSNFVCYGQSWAVGGSISKQYIISYQSMFENLMLSGGLFPHRYFWDHSSFVTLCEDDTIHGTCFETPASGQCDMVSNLLLAENNFYDPNTFQLITATPGRGGYTIDQLSRGTEPYTNFMNALTWSKQIADGLGKSYKVLAFSFINGSLDKAKMIALQQAVNYDVQSTITEQEETVRMFTWQSEVHDPTKDYYEAYAEVSDGYVFCAFPGYIIPHLNEGAGSSNNIHFTPEGSRIAGEYFGILYKRVIIDGNTGWKPLRPTNTRIDGNDLYITFNVPVGSLRFDTDIVKPETNYGFTLFDASDNVKTITGVTIVDTDKVKISCNEAINSSDKIAYAYTPHEDADNPYAPWSIARGQLCDSQDIESMTGRSLPNFCIAFKKPISFWNN